MVLGIQGVVRSHDVEPGRFYLAEHYGDDSRLFQCIRTGRQVEGEAELAGLYFDPTGEDPLSIEYLPHQGPLVALPQVQVRVDAPSMCKTSSSSPIRKHLLLVSGDEVYAIGSNGRMGWSLVNLGSGDVKEGQNPAYWIAFGRWQLVMMDGDEEVSIASFGEGDH